MYAGRIRFTPAYAGNTQADWPAAVPSWVHPRIRGEYPDAGRSLGSSLGSPPHTRGIQKTDQEIQTKVRFTPAYAGNTGIAIVITCRNQVHPRIRGEYFRDTFSDDFVPGSPPHTRGIPAFSPSGRFPHGFTPAYAGNTNQVCEQSS